MSEFQGLLGFLHFYIIFILVLHYTSTHTMSCCYCLLYPWVGAVTGSFKDLVTVEQENHQPNSGCFGRGSATASFKDLVTVEQENHQPNSGCFGRGSTTASFKDLVTVEQENHQPNSGCFGRGSATASIGLGNS